MPRLPKTSARRSRRLASHGSARTTWRLSFSYLMEHNIRHRRELIWPRQFYLRPSSRRLPSDRHTTVGCRKRPPRLCSGSLTKFAESVAGIGIEVGKEAHLVRCSLPENRLVPRNGKGKLRKS